MGRNKDDIPHQNGSALGSFVHFEQTHVLCVTVQDVA